MAPSVASTPKPLERLPGPRMEPEVVYRCSACALLWSSREYGRDGAMNRYQQHATLHAQSYEPAGWIA